MAMGIQYGGRRRRRARGADQRAKRMHNSSIARLVESTAASRCMHVCSLVYTYSWRESCLEMSWRKERKEEKGPSAVALALTPSWPREPPQAVTMAST